MEDFSDVVIIGAGAAGLSAALDLADAGLSISLLEARDRIGGRMFTRRDAMCSAPIELGAEFIHGLPPEIWTPLQENQIDVTEVEGDNWCFQNGSLNPCAYFGEVDELLNQMDDSGPDESFVSFLDRCCTSSDPRQQEIRRRALGYVSGFNAADPALVSVHWLVQSMREDSKIEGDRAFRMAGGYATLVDILAQRLKQKQVTPRLNTIVEKIDWKKNELKVTARHQDELVNVKARHALITVPLGVLKSKPDDEGTIRFTPELPAEKQVALNGVVMGKVTRVTLCFRERFWKDIRPVRGKSLESMSFLFAQQQETLIPTWWTMNPEVFPLLTAWAPFRYAEQFSGKTDDFVVESCMGALAEILTLPKEKLQSDLISAYWHDWQSDPFSRGAYSYVKVGGTNAPRILGAPLENTLFFAGEATDVSGHNGTVHGAIASGNRAAKEMLKSLDR